MVKRGSQPTVRGSSVAGLAIGWETRLEMGRIGRPVVIGLMAIHTVGGSACVSTVGMTQSAVGGTMLPVERPDDVVIKRRTQPTVRGSSVAGLAIGGETRL